MEKAKVLSPKCADALTCNQTMSMTCSPATPTACSQSVPHHLPHVPSQSRVSRAVCLAAPAPAPGPPFSPGTGYGCSMLDNHALSSTHIVCAGNSTEALFVYNHSAACYWYNTQQSPTGHRQQQYRVAGWLAGQALHNRAPLGIPLAPLLWQKVLEGNQFQAGNPHLTLHTEHVSSVARQWCMKGSGLHVAGA